MISLKGITKRYGAFLACEPIDLEIERGEFFSLLGPSGCGKTTMMRMVAGFVTPSAGEVLIDGQPMTRLPPNKRPVNMVFQNYAIFPHLNVEQNIGFGLRRLGLGASEIRRQVEEALDLIDLRTYGKRRAHELSGGERQRIALARALVCKPKALLLDEPLGALDKKLRERMQMELRELQRRVGITFLFVTHDQEEALSMSTRICVMNRGKVVEIATPGDLYNRPQSRFAAEFVGTMNLLECKVVAGGRLVSNRLEDVVIDAGLPFDTPQGGDLTIGIRPESIRLDAANAPVDPHNSAAAAVTDVSYLGDRWIIQTRVGGGQMLLSIPQSAASVPSVGQAVRLSWGKDAIRMLKND